MAEEVMHWADQAAEQIVKERETKEKYVVAAGITPSGTIHIGNFREMITVDLVNRALKTLGKQVRFIYSWDNYDVFRKVPVDAPEKEVLEKYLRYPITEVPDTYDHKHKSYAEHNEKEVENTIPAVDIHPQFLYQADKYKSCEYAEQIKLALDNKKGIKVILDKYRAEEKSEDWWPVSVFCDSCKKDITKITDWNGQYSLTYECKCGHKETFDFRKKGIAKLPWRIDWPMRWNYEKVDFEPGGKEHSTPGGSRTTAVEIFQLLYKNKPPIYLKYDFITIKGKGGKISKSLGNLVSLGDTLEIYEPDIVRYLFASTRPDTEFAISFDLDVLKIYEDFEKCERIYYNKEEVNEKDKKKQSRIYELSVVKLHKEMRIQPSFRHLTNIYQVYEGDTHKIMNYYSEELKTEADKERLKIRIKCAKNWLEKYAPEEMKFKINTDVPTNLEINEKQKTAIKKVAELLGKQITEEELHNKFWEICQEQELTTQEFFKIAYKILINKERGPKLAGFILTIDKEKVKKLFEQI